MAEEKMETQVVRKKMKQHGGRRRDNWCEKRLGYDNRRKEMS